MLIQFVFAFFVCAFALVILWTFLLHLWCFLLSLYYTYLCTLVVWWLCITAVPCDNTIYISFFLNRLIFIIDFPLSFNILPKCIYTSLERINIEQHTIWKIWYNFILIFRSHYVVIKSRKLYFDTVPLCNAYMHLIWFNFFFLLFFRIFIFVCVFGLRWVDQPRYATIKYAIVQQWKHFQAIEYARQEKNTSQTIATTITKNIYKQKKLI